MESLRLLSFMNICPRSFMNICPRSFMNICPRSFMNIFLTACQCLSPSSFDLLLPLLHLRDLAASYHLTKSNYHSGTNQFITYRLVAPPIVHRFHMDGQNTLYMLSVANEEHFSSCYTQTRTLITTKVSLPWLGTQEDTQKIAHIRHACNSDITLNQPENTVVSLALLHPYF